MSDLKFSNKKASGRKVLPKHKEFLAFVCVFFEPFSEAAFCTH